jgi:hypothetical protein
MCARLVTYLAAFAVAAVLASTVSRAESPTPDLPAQREAWSVSVRIEPMPTPSSDYRCPVTVKSLLTAETLDIPSFFVSPGKPGGVTLPADSRGRTRQAQASIAKDLRIATWNVAVGVGAQPLLLSERLR